MRDALFAVGNWIALIVAFGLVGVWITYGLLFRWRRTMAGTAFFVLLTSLSLTIIMNTATLWLGKIWLPDVFGDDTVVREIVRIGIYLYGAYALAFVVWGLVYNWRRAGEVITLELRARKAQALLDGKPPTKEIEIP